jgi:N-acylneuraminate cytidylyltransferase
MVEGQTVIAIIPARGGSKSLPRKNVRILRDKPLIAYSIFSALDSATIDRVIVSTDDAEIASVARAYGAEVPFVRPAELALDMTPDLPVFEHALGWLAQHEGFQPDLVVHLRPTSPVRDARDTDGAVRLLAGRPDADSVRGVSLTPVTPFKMYRVGADGCLRPLLADEDPFAHNAPRQSLPPCYRGNGAIDVTRRVTITNQHSMTGTKVLPWILEGHCVDLDTPEDWEHLEWLVSTGRVRLPGTAGTRDASPHDG